MSQYEPQTTDEKQEMYLVLINHEEQYSLWPSYKPIPLGWSGVGKERTKEECLAYIEEVWTDMRPLSLRKQMLIMTSMIFLGLSPAKAMMDVNEEGKTPMPSKTQVIQQSLDQKEVMLSKPSKKDTSFESLPNMLFTYIFSFLDIMDLGRVAQVSTRWKKAAYAPYLWKSMGSRYYGDYLNEEDLKEDPKQKIIFHYLSIIVNSSNDLQEIEGIVNRYHLDLYSHPFHNHLRVNLVDSFLTNIVHREELIVHRNPSAIDTKIEGLAQGKYGYTRNPVASKEFNDYLVEKGDPKAIERKINGLIWGQYGYEQDRTAAREFNDYLVEKGDPHAIGATLYALCGSGSNYIFLYKKDLVAAREFNDYLVKKGDPKAIERKIQSLMYGKGGYEKNLEALREFNESLIKKGDPEAIERKINGLMRGRFGYAHNLTEAREVNELLVKKGDLWAIKRKIEELTEGGEDYEENRLILRNSNELLIEKGDPTAIKKKFKGLEKGVDGYKQDLEAAREFNDSLIEKGDQEAIERKIEGLMGAKYGYKQNLEALREFNDYLVEKGDSRAIERKIEGMEEGRWYGYKKDPVAARKLNEFLVEKGNPKAIERKIEGLLYGKGGYEKNLEALREFNDYLVEKGDLAAIKRKRKALLDGGGIDYELMGYHQLSFQRGGGGMPWVTFYIPTYGYKKDPTAVKEFDKVVHMILVEKGDLAAIQEKVIGLGMGTYGYEKNPILAREFIESLSLNKTPIVRGIGMYIKAAAMKYGFSQLGYEQDRNKAIQFIRDNHIPS